MYAGVRAQQQTCTTVRTDPHQELIRKLMAAVKAARWGSLRWQSVTTCGPSLKEMFRDTLTIDWLAGEGSGAMVLGLPPAASRFVEPVRLSVLRPPTGKMYSYPERHPRFLGSNVRPTHVEGGGSPGFVSKETLCASFLPSCGLVSNTYEVRLIESPCEFVASSQPSGNL